MANNEKALCEALIRLLEEDLGHQRSEVTHPETDHSGPPVETRLRIANTRFAIEHTLIEPFPLAIQTGKWFQELTAEIEVALNGAMPSPGTYRLVFPVHPTQGKPRHTHVALRKLILQWVREAGEELHNECPERLDRHHKPQGFRGVRTTEIEGIPLSLTLLVHWSESGRHDGALFLSRAVGDDVEDQRRIRIRTALDKKLPKLADCRAEGDISVLILEYADVALTNQVLVAAALEAELAGRLDCPDHIFLADTTGDQSWHLFQPVADQVFSIDMEYIDISAPEAVTSKDDLP
ncbi:hypothetical protein N5C66_13925 [Rhizobium pusense]|jgi:hypothetical protein|uniref:hypothetical protein n=1 Tax=Agrobacterium pusense TaxID=648995 RepID=UPI000D1AF568|nr:MULTISPECIES: hypothetical protein [Alphaproteobacteria]MDH0909650.1 hypothetical protein [Agrobacterium pusense]MDH1095659.1 hypothetical protein [Agrobacterium pusense]MDH1112836.1 hypothetical protein [Agrobacterium pusense]MDH2191984.1 hypothetical protein [Agrobacterium pusense]